MKTQDRLTVQELEIVRDILVRTPQSSFKGSYPIMNSICRKIALLLENERGKKWWKQGVSK